MNQVYKVNLQQVLLLVLILIALFFRLYQLNQRYVFDWDQADDAIKVTEMIKHVKPLLIGPRVANESGFFVGPFHYYFLLPFYLILAGNPYAGAFASVSVALTTVIISSILVYRLFGLKTAFISTLFIAASNVTISWNVMYTPILSIIIFYLCYQFITKNKSDLLPWIFFTYSFSATTHLVPASLIIPIIVTIIIAKPKFSSTIILKTIVLSFVPLIPLLIFDLKHDFLNFKSLISFVTTPKTSTESVQFLFLRSYWRSLSFLYINSSLIQSVFKAVLIVVSILEIFYSKNPKIRFLISTWLLTPILILAFYHGNIPEYYYGASLILYPILFAKFLSRLNYRYLIVASLVIIFIQFQIFLTKPSRITLKNKLDLVSYLVNQKTDPHFNFSYDLPQGLNTGFNYLFDYLGRQPENIPEGHLYSVFLMSNPPLTGQVVYSDNILGLVRR